MIMQHVHGAESNRKAAYDAEMHCHLEQQEESCAGCLMLYWPLLTGVHVSSLQAK